MSKETNRAEVNRALGIPESVADAALQAVRTLNGQALAELLRQHPPLIEAVMTRGPRSTLLHEAVAVEPASTGRKPEEVIGVIDQLLAAGCDIARDSYGLNFFAVRAGSPEVVEHILRKGSNPNGGIFSAGPTMITLLHRYGADINQEGEGETVLLHALKNKSLEMVRVLLDLGADPNRADSGLGAAPLHYAVRQYHDPQVIALLLSHGASPTLRTKRGNTPIDVALQMGRFDIAAQLGAPLGKDGAPATQPRGDDVTLRPFVGVEGRTLERVADFYKELGFECVQFDLEDGFAQVTLAEARIMLVEGDHPRHVIGDQLLFRCPPEVHARVRAAAEERALPRALTPDLLSIDDPTGYQVRFVREAGRQVAAVEPSLDVSDLARSLAFYQTLGFEQVHTDSTEGATVQLHQARIHLREQGGRAVSERALRLWLTCEDFDGTYRRLASRIRIDPPEVTFFGVILFSIVSPDGHYLLFNTRLSDL